MTKAFNLQDHGITVAEIHRNLPPSVLYEYAIRYEKDASIAQNGALVAYSGDKTGRSPKDRRVVKQGASENDIWWGPNTRDRLYCFDGFAGWDPKNRIKVRVICSRPYHALFMHTMLIRPTKHELEDFGAPDLIIYNAGAFPANRLTSSMGSKTTVDLSIEENENEFVILGTEYAGEMKKGVFTLMNYLEPKRGVLSMHCSVPAEILIPRNLWADKEAFDATAKKLAGLFIKNFAAYEGGRKRRSQSRRSGCNRIKRRIHLQEQSCLPASLSW